MQRLAIARAVFSESPILLLDEATSALDGATEQRVLENLRRMTYKTVVIVTPRPAALSICTRVIDCAQWQQENQNAWLQDEQNASVLWIQSTLCDRMPYFRCKMHCRSGNGFCDRFMLYYI